MENEQSTCTVAIELWYQTARSKRVFGSYTKPNKKTVCMQMKERWKWDVNGSDTDILLISYLFLYFYSNTKSDTDNISFCRIKF